jgi:hypothetical protein
VSETLCKTVDDCAKFLGALRTMKSESQTQNQIF